MDKHFPEFFSAREAVGKPFGSRNAEHAVAAWRAHVRVNEQHGVVEFLGQTPGQIAGHVRLAFVAHGACDQEHVFGTVAFLNGQQLFLEQAVFLPHRGCADELLAGRGRAALGRVAVTGRRVLPGTGRRGQRRGRFRFPSGGPAGFFQGLFDDAHGRSSLISRRPAF